MASAATSWLDTAHESDWAGAPYFAETVKLLRSVRDHDFDSLADLCDDDFGIVDLDQSGGSVMIRTRAEWENWFRRLFAELDAASASTDSEILSYQAVETADLGYSVVEFRQSLGMGGSVANFDCVVTIIWKRTEAGWKEARWHVSLLSTDLPEGFPTG
jgi:ketosteroid isomerase-like protein